MANARRRMKRRPGWTPPPATNATQPTMNREQLAEMGKIARAQDKLNEWKAENAPELLPAKPALPWQSRKVYGKGVVIETAKARKIVRGALQGSPLPKRGEA